MGDEDDVSGYYYASNRDDYRYHTREPELRLETREFRAEPRTIRVSWTRQTLDNLEDLFYFDTNEYLLRGRPDGSIEGKGKEYRRNSRKYRTIRI